MSAPAGKTIAVVGGAGYLGMALASVLVPSNRVIVVDRIPPAAGFGGEFRECDVRRAGDCRDALSGAEIVFHRAGLYGNLPSMARAAEYFDVNLAATQHVLEACVANGVRRLVFDSTSFVYGRHVCSPVAESAAAQPCSIYGATKLACEQMLSFYDRERGLPGVALRFCRVRDAARRDVVTIFAERILRGEVIELVDDGAPALDFVDREDAALAAALAAGCGMRDCAVNISCGRAASLRELVAMIETISGRKASVRATRAGMRPPSAEYLFGPDHFALDIGRARRELGWSPRKSLEAMVRETVEHVARRG